MGFHYKPKEKPTKQGKKTTKQPQPQSVGVFSPFLSFSLHLSTDSGKIDRTNGFDVAGYGYTAQHEKPATTAGKPQQTAF